jgi:hypothetical protein
MESLKQALELHQTNLQTSLPDTTKSTEISLYGEGKVSSKVLADCVIKLKFAFPKLQMGFYEILGSMLIDEKFTDQRLIDSTNNLIKTCIYPEPTIASLLGYDKKAKLYTWDELAKISNDYSPQMRSTFFAQYNMVRINEQPRYVDKIYASYFR